MKSVNINKANVSLILTVAVVFLMLCLSIITFRYFALRSYNIKLTSSIQNLNLSIRNLHFSTKPLGAVGSDNIDYPAINILETVFTGQETTFFQMNVQIESNFSIYAEELENQWQMSGDLLKAAFIMNAINFLLPIGDELTNGRKTEIDVFHNPNISEERGERLASDGIWSISTAKPFDYLNAFGASCNDFAMLMYIFLNMNGIENRQVGDESHIYNEVYIGDRTYIFDALNNFYTEMSISEFLNQDVKEPVTYMVFPQAATSATSPKLYRPHRMKARFLHFINYGRTTKYQQKDYSHWNQFERWIREDKVSWP